MAARYLSKNEAAAYMGISRASIERLLREDKLHALRPLSGRTLIDKVAIDRFMRASRGNESGRGSKAQLATV